MSTGGEKVVAILDIHLPELELELEKAYFVELVKIKSENSNLNSDLLK